MSGTVHSRTIDAAINECRKGGGNQLIQLYLEMCMFAQFAVIEWLRLGLQLLIIQVRSRSVLKCKLIY